MKRRLYLFSAVLAVLGALLILGRATAQQATPLPAITVSDDQVNAVAHELYCPVCENIPLDVCPTQACAQWRELIRLKLSEGSTKEQIKQYFAAQYGDRVLAEPPRQGLNWLVAILQYYVMMLAFFPNPTFLSAVFALGVAALGIAAPSSPGALGVFEAALVAACGRKQEAATDDTDSPDFSFFSQIFAVSHRRAADVRGTNGVFFGILW